MSLFDKLVDEAIASNPKNFLDLRMVVEKELLHHDILKIMSQSDFLKDLTFIGGTCLRMCYGSTRLSEDLDFSGGSSFSRESLVQMQKILQQTLQEKYGLHTEVSAPWLTTSNVSTWKIKIITRPEKKDMPAQKIHLDICSVPSYQRKLSLLINHYDVEMGTSGLALFAQNREEIYTDKLVAFAFRPNRIKYRDLWDIAWLHQKGITPWLEGIAPKLEDHKYSTKDFSDNFLNRLTLLHKNATIAKEFAQEISRFLPKSSISSESLLSAIEDILHDIWREYKKIF